MGFQVHDEALQEATIRGHLQAQEARLQSYEIEQGIAQIEADEWDGTNEQEKANAVTRATDAKERVRVTKKVVASLQTQLSDATKARVKAEAEAAKKLPDTES